MLNVFNQLCPIFLFIDGHGHGFCHAYLCGATQNVPNQKYSTWTNPFLFSIVVVVSSPHSAHKNLHLQS